MMNFPSHVRKLDSGTLCLFCPTKNLVHLLLPSVHMTLSSAYLNHYTDNYLLCEQVRMVEDDLMYSTFLEVYENHCARNDREADLPITYFKEQLNQAISGQISPEAVVDLRLEAYSEITKKYVSDGIFSQYMYKTLLSGNHMWAFKKQFAIQLALSSFMSFMLQIGGRSPNKILFAKNTGKIFQTDFHPAYDANGMIEFNEPVPFRLTRNMQAFFSHFGVEGLIVSAMCAAAQAVVSPKVSCTVIRASI